MGSVCLAHPTAPATVTVCLHSGTLYRCIGTELGGSVHQDSVQQSIVLLITVATSVPSPMHRHSRTSTPAFVQPGRMKDGSRAANCWFMTKLDIEVLPILI